MRSLSHPSDVLRSGGFWLHGIIGRMLKVGFVSQNVLLTLVSAAVLLVAAAADHSLYLPERDVGLLEHPTQWGFLILQLILPISISRSIGQLEQTTIAHGEIARRDGKSSNLILPGVLRFLGLRDWQSRIAATLVYFIGGAAWLWNTYQNQFPRIIVPYDFWDSTTFLTGYTVTRFHKFYLFAVLLPYLAMIHIAILWSTLSVVRAAREKGELHLLPFHPDGSGGLAFVAGFISKPITWTLLIGSLTTAGALFVHRAAHFTPVAGVSILVAWALLAYFVPILFLRRDIIALKRNLMNRIHSAQQQHYSKALDGKRLDLGALEEENAASEYFDRIRKRIESISNYPHWKALFAGIGLAVTPSLITVTGKALMSLVPFINRVLKQF
jgi:hypothetical protein